MADHYRIEPVGRGTARSDRIGRALESHWLVAQRCQHLLVAQQPFPFALDDEHGLAAPERQHLWAGHCGAVCHRRGQPRLEAASVSRIATYVHRSIMVTNDFAHRCEAQSSSCQAGREERLKHSSRHTFVEAAPGVDDSQAHVAARRELAMAQH